jgi:hypothetical protein
VRLVDDGLLALLVRLSSTDPDAATRAWLSGALAALPDNDRQWFHIRAGGGPDEPDVPADEVAAVRAALRRAGPRLAYPEQVLPRIGAALGSPVPSRRRQAAVRLAALVEVLGWARQEVPADVLIGLDPPPAEPVGAIPPDLDETLWSGNSRPVREPGQEPVRTAHARLEAPATVTAGSTFEARVGLAATAGPEVLAAGPLSVPAEPFTLTVKLVVHGFTVLGPATAELAVTGDDPFPYTVFRLRALDDPALRPARSLLVEYSVGRQVIGVATRIVEVLPPDAARAITLSAAAPAERQDAPGGDWALPTGPGDDADLTILVKNGDDEQGRTLQWSLSSPHPQVPVPPGTIDSHLDGGQADWVRRVASGVDQRKGADDLAEYLRGIGQVVADAVPAEVWAALEACAAVVAQPAVLLSTAEPYVPWELAAAPRPWLPGAAPYLGAQTRLGRWVYPRQGRSPAPPVEVRLGRLAVVAGSYPGADRLEQAEAEAKDLQTLYGATVLPARARPILDCLGGAPAVEAVHVAAHGNHDSSGYSDGILLEDGRYLDPLTVRGVVRSPVRLVFLNACMLGRGQSMLGDAAGMAPALVAIGACAVVAPLWRVDDTVARDLAVRFFSALRAGTPGPAEFFAAERTAGASSGEGTPDGTRLAYLFFGHPRLRVVWTDPGGQ